MVHEEDAIQFSTVVENSSRADRGDIRRSFDPMLHPALGVDGCQTLYESFRRAVTINPLGPCMGFRAVSTNGMATPFIYTSFAECKARIDAFAAGLETLELVEPNEDGMVLISLFMKNCMEWVLAEYAIYCLGGATVPLYDTLGPDTTRFILSQTGAKSVVATRDELDRLCKAKLTGDCPRLKSIILVDGATAEAARMAQDASLEVLSFAKVESVGAQVIATKGHKHRPPSPKDVATFCYTSGTTGDPKGALLTHENFVATIAGVKGTKVIEVEMWDRHLSYLPLAHIFERCVQAQFLSAGASIAFFRGDPTLLIEDLQACRPTILPVAPRVLNKIHDKIVAGITAAGGLKRKLFDAGIAAKKQSLQKGHLTHPLYDHLLFNKIRKALGMDHLRCMVSGSAPLSENVMMFFRCLGIPLVEGYGQTEGCAAATIGRLEDMASLGHVGGPTGATEIVLVDVPEMGYRHTDTEHRGQPCQGRGEIWVRGPVVFKGYYKDEAKTKETVDEEGWLHSGDIGMWNMQGALQIIDRKKNIFKLSQGEYVAPEKIENILMRSPLIAQCFVYGDSFQSSLVAIVIPDEEPTLNWALSKESLGSASFQELCKSDDLKSAILADIQELSKSNGLHGFETVKAIHLDHTQFSVENGLATPTFKLKRPQAKDYYQKEIDKLYASLPAPRSKL